MSKPSTSSIVDTEPMVGGVVPERNTVIRRVIVIGASLSGVTALLQVVKESRRICMPRS